MVGADGDYMNFIRMLPIECIDQGQLHSTLFVVVIEEYQDHRNLPTELTQRDDHVVDTGVRKVRSQLPNLGCRILVGDLRRIQKIVVDLLQCVFLGLRRLRLLHVEKPVSRIPENKNCQKQRKFRAAAHQPLLPRLSGFMQPRVKTGSHESPKVSAISLPISSFSPMTVFTTLPLLSIKMT